ncbi:MAG: hypothetical protein KJ747_07320 [Actinobacteria bacterium]|nr:hypothetical protein [Actinomycetota bacterium]MCG2808343.1 hypothetical protein [Coriobacteriia bacterium]
MRPVNGIASKSVMVALVAAALIAVLIPVCAMQLCGPTGAGGMMGMDLGSALDCEHMYFPSDAPSALVIPMFVLFVVFAAIMLLAERPLFATVSSQRFMFVVPDDPDPPGDPLVGRLRV